ncbi:Methyladenine glycosylase [Parasponia andersonii]|uniref:Methyladenine glycosylase n=1 Tax=Parasponia andersonii TaxID=3476 RepID=A0A2P5B735_PARAD|nr:Methyladenine glycosylase [Parasponia andersonii]
MCSSKPKSHQMITTPKLNGRPVLQPTCNRVSSLERRMSVKKSSTKSPTSSPPLALPIPNAASYKAKAPSTVSPPVSPKLPSPRPPAIKRGKDPNELNSSSDKVFTPRCTTKSTNSIKKSKKFSGLAAETSLKQYPSSLMVESPGSIAAARREQVAIMQEERKNRIAHYGRTKSAKYEGKVAPPVLDSSTAGVVGRERKRCSYITPNSDPIYVTYHDDEWGVPVHDDKLLFELLLLTGAQVGSDWTSVLKKRQTFRDALSGFDAEAVAKYNEKKITSISTNFNIELSLIRGTVDNAIRILEIKKEFGSLDKYLWGFVNHKPISTQYKLCQKIPVKTSKSESISKDMVRRGFRFVGPTVIHSLMQAAGLTNDHLISCPRHLQCIALASQTPTVAPAL